MPRFPRRSRRASVRAGRGAAGAGRRALHEADRRERPRPQRLARRRHRRRQPGVRQRAAGRGRSRRRGDPAGAVLLQPRDGRRDGAAAGRSSCRPTRGTSCDVEAIAARHHAAHARRRDDLAEQPDRRRVPRGRPARGERAVRRARRLAHPRRGVRVLHLRRRRHFSPGSIPGADAHTISLYSLSKAYGFASWRIGYMTIPEALWVAVNKIQDTLLICPPHVSQAAAVGALGAGRAWCDTPHRRRSPTCAGACWRGSTAIGDLAEAPSADGALYCLLRVRTAIDSMTLAERLIREHRVATVPGSAFGCLPAAAWRRRDRRHLPADLVRRAGAGDGRRRDGHGSSAASKRLSGRQAGSWSGRRRVSRRATGSWHRQFRLRREMPDAGRVDGAEP